MSQRSPDAPPPAPRPYRLAASVLVLGLMVTGGALLGTFPDHRVPIGAGLVVVGVVLIGGLWLAQRAGRRH